MTTETAAAVEPLLPLHLDHLLERNQRPRSIRERRYAVLRAAQHLRHPVLEVTRDELRAWRSALVERMAPPGQKNEIVHVTQYLRWCVAAGHRAEDPTPVLVRPRVRDRLPRPLSDTAIRQAIAAADQPLRAWLALGAFCGLRCMEIASLARSDVVDDADAPFLRILGKGEKERIVPLPAAVLTELRTAGMPIRGHLFSRLDGRPGPPSAMRVSERINDHLHGLGIAGTAHGLRHRFGTRLYEATRDPFLVATVMGHVSVDTTRGYVLLSPHAAAGHVERISRLAEMVQPC